MSEDLIIRICPNCGARNAPNTTICMSCGVNIPMFQSAQEEMQKRQRDKTDSHRKELEETTATAISKQKEQVKKQHKLQLRVLFVIAGLVAIAIIAGVALYAYQLRLYRERIANDYDRALTCLKSADFLCARDGFAALLAVEPVYRDASQKLNEARLGLANQYANLEQWQLANDEINAILSASSKDPQALAMQKSINDRKIASDYKRSMDCLQKEDFICARDGFIALLQKSPGNSDAAQRLVDARLGLARKYARSYEWELSVTELDNILRVPPKNAEAWTLLKNIYDQWYDDAVSRGDLITAARVAFDRNLRFGNEK